MTSRTPDSFDPTNTNIVVGTNRDNILIAPSGAAVFGNSAIFGYAGDDLILGLEGNYFADGGAGNDLMLFGTGLGEVYAGDGNDIVLVGIENIGLSGITFALSSNRTFIDAGSGDDTVIGAAGNQTIHGCEGNDFLWGGDDRDTLEGGDGADVLAGGAGADTMIGGGDADLIVASGGDEIYTDQFDTIVFNATDDGTVSIFGATTGTKFDFSQIAESPETGISRSDVTFAAGEMHIDHGGASLTVVGSPYTSDAAFDAGIAGGTIVLSTLA